MKFPHPCPGPHRRDLLRIGALGATGLSLSQFLRLAQANTGFQGKAQSAIFVELEGGPSHLDSFDLKPEAPAEIRGEFNPIPTNVAGIQISEHLPNLARCADKFAIIRGVSHTLAAHELGREYVNTGTRPISSMTYPGYGAVVSKELAARSGIPPFVAIPNTTQRAGFLGLEYSPLKTMVAPVAGKPFSVRGISLSSNTTLEEIGQRHKLLKSLDRRFDSIENHAELIQGLDEFDQQALELIMSPKARKAFDISKEEPLFAKPFGEETFSQSCLLAIRLVEAGVRFVTTTLPGWDTHADNFNRLKSGLLPKLDRGLSALLNGLESRGLLESTLVFVTGEFGRTPKINSRDGSVGRDHYPRCMFMLMAGGGVRGGQVIGSSDQTAAGPAHDPISPDDMAASLYHGLGIDPQKEYQSDTGRPITLVRDGHVVSKLFS